MSIKFDNASYRGRRAIKTAIFSARAYVVIGATARDGASVHRERMECAEHGTFDVDNVDRACTQCLLRDETARNKVRA